MEYGRSARVQQSQQESENVTVSVCLYLEGRDLKLTWVGERDANACKKHKKREDW